MTFFEFYETLLNFVLFKLYSDIGVRFPLSVQSLGDEAAATGAGSTSSVLSANLCALTYALDSAKSGSAIRNAIAESVSGATTTDGGKKAAMDNDETKDTASKAKTSMKDKELIASVGAALSKLASEEKDSDDDGADEDDVDVAGPLKAALDSMADAQAKESLPGGTKNKNAAHAELDNDAVRRKGLFRGLVFFLSREIPRGYLELVCLAHGAKVVGWQGDDDGKSPIAMNDSSITHHICDRPRLPLQYDSLPKSREYVQPQWILDCANFMFLLPIARYAIGATLPPHLSPWVDNEEEGYKPAYAEEVNRLKNGEAVDLSVDVMDASAVKKQDREGHESDGAADLEKDAEAAEEQEGDEEDEEEEDEESEKARERREKKHRKEEKEAHDLAKTMMSRKASHLYDRMQHGIAQKSKKVEALQKKREEIEGKQKGVGSKSVLKQKVERLKKERKDVEDTYASSAGTMKKSKKRRTNK
jgi:pescadillo